MSELLLLMIYDFHIAILLDPQLANDDVVDAACGVGPGIGFFVTMQDTLIPVFNISVQ